jgi:hypothetical protein
MVCSLWVDVRNHERVTSLAVNLRKRRNLSVAPGRWRIAAVLSRAPSCGSAWSCRSAAVACWGGCVVSCRVGSGRVCYRRAGL